MRMRKKKNLVPGWSAEWRKFDPILYEHQYWRELPCARDPGGSMRQGPLHQAPRRRSRTLLIAIEMVPDAMVVLWSAA